MPLVTAMSETEQKVLLRLEVHPELRSRIKALAARMGKTMPETVEMVLSSKESLEDFENKFFGK